MLGRLDESEASARWACELDPMNATAFHNLGVILLRRRRLAEAEPLLRRAQKLLPRAQTLAAIGDVLHYAGRLRESMEHYKRAVKADPTLVAVRGNLATLYVQFGQPEDGLAHAKAAVEMAPKNVGAHLRLGKLLLELGRNNEAMDAFAAGLTLDPNHPRLCLYNGQAWLRMGKYVEAVSWAELRISP